jgi:hypothetical protein
MWDKSRDFTRLAKAMGLRWIRHHHQSILKLLTLMRASTEGHIVRTKSSYALPDRYGDSYSGSTATYPSDTDVSYIVPDDA